jgi:hypothetical protein
MMPTIKLPLIKATCRGNKVAAVSGLRIFALLFHAHDTRTPMLNIQHS